MKKLFIISSVALAVVLIFAVIYGVVFKKDKTVDNGVVATEKTTSTKKEIDKKNEKESETVITKISKETVIAPTLSKTQDNIWYFSKKVGNIKQIAFSGPVRKTLAVSRDNIQGIRNVQWSPNKEKVLYARGSGQYLYDLKRLEEKELKQGLDMAVWTNLGDRMVYKFYNDIANDRTLNISDLDGKNWKILANLDNTFRHMEVRFVPQSNFISYWNSPDAFAETSFNLVSLFHGWDKEIISGKFGADYLWSPDGNKIFSSFLTTDNANNGKMGIAVYDNYGKQLIKMSFPTLASKCAWSNDSQYIYCAFITDIPEDATMPNDYYQKKFTVKDTFYKIDTKTGKKERIVELKDIDQEYDATNLFLSVDEIYLFFVNRRDDYLYRITL